MTALTRDAIFISHANPEDNSFTVWLGARLTAAGYEVWADVLRLRGGQDWQRLLEDALRNKACKVLLVGTERGVQKQGVRNEIQIAHTVGRSIGDADFVIPLRLTNFDAPFLIAHAQYIDFKRSWADGLAELLATLEDAETVPRKRDSASETMDYWKQVHLRHGQSLTPTPEPLVTNWLSFEQPLPRPAGFPARTWHRRAWRCSCNTPISLPCAVCSTGPRALRKRGRRRSAARCTRLPGRHPR